MANPTSTPESRQAAGQQSKGKKGTSNKAIAEPTGAFALPPPKPEYYEHNGLRKVRPYIFTFKSFAKERWQDRTLIDIYSEFRDRSEEYYNWAIETGVIVVNNQKSTPERIIQNGDLISNVLHRHEPPVVTGAVKILYDGRLPGHDGETLVVEKPGSMPVHPTGRYNFNTLLEILKWDYGLPLVHTSNRLDRLTSGVMVCALTVKKSKELGAWFGGRRKEGGVGKEYVARCLGKFPEEEVICEEKLLTIDRQIGVNVVHPEGRESKTIFNRLSYDQRSDTSVVHCKPITGRSHQIRVHLQFLGHPIANDPIYQNTAAWGESGGKGGVFGSSRGGTEEEKAERRERGERYKAKEEEQKAAFEMHLQSAQEGSPCPTPAIADSTTPPTETAGSASPLPAETEETISTSRAADLDRKPHDPLLTPSAAQAIETLRQVRDKDDGHARTRDLEGVELARLTLTGSKNQLSIDAAAEEGGEGEKRGEGEGGKGEVEEVFEEEDGAAQKGQGGFCKTCFTPLLPDPRPEQLFIWLHAMRYHTVEWDFQSELPYWAEETYEVPLSSILA
ncbi:hypothetical protein JCM11641_005264 [Rhodosporidiobolus odoratus]